MATFTQSSLPSMHRKPHINTTGALTTVDAFECVSNSDTDVDTITEVGSLTDSPSQGPEPTEGDQEALIDELDEFKDKEEFDRAKILRALGFDVCPNNEPLLPAPSPSTSACKTTQPPPYLNLFWRQYKASQQQDCELTADRLNQQNAVLESLQDSDVLPMTAGEWLGQFKRNAKEVPVKSFAMSFFGNDLGSDVACFMGADGLKTTSEHSATALEAEDAPCGHYVIGSKYVPIPATVGRAGFFINEAASISTPDSSSDRNTFESEASSDYFWEDDVVTGDWWLTPADCMELQDAAFTGAL
mmetsp:Transcript_73541/g.203008  ORF Transcript_73541/g.203008 Transcript_73541/m.203008 type:complete len:301 (-) Transcript_73541:287-1189(-)